MAIDDINFGINIGMNVSFEEAVKMGKILEENKFNSFWIADIGFGRDSFVTITHLLRETKKLKVGPGVVNPFTRHPLTVGIALASLNEIAPKRVVAAIGSGDIHIFELFGLERPRPVVAVREAYTIIKKLLNNEEVNFHGEIFNVHNAKLFFKNKSRIPIYIAGKGKKMLRLAGEMGDGVYLDAVPIELMPQVHRFILEGAEEGNNNLENYKFVNVITLSIDEDRNIAYEKAKKGVVYAVASLHKYQIKHLGIDEHKIKEIRDSFPNVDQASKLLDDRIIKYFSISGTPEDCIRKIRYYTKVGINEFAFIMPREVAFEKNIRIIKEYIINEWK